jgi:hypothetical protein
LSHERFALCIAPALRNESICMPAHHPEAKPCVACGRVITWRKKWERDWDNVKFCSNACRKHKPGALDVALEQAILSLLRSRPRTATICPSEAARNVAASPAHATQDWNALMEPTRKAARRLVAQGLINITQQGRVVDASEAKGAIRLKLT